MALKVAIVHDHLVQDGGAERVVRSLMRIFPGAPIYTLLYEPDKMGADFEGKDIRTSQWQTLPFFRKHYKLLLPFIDGAFRKFDLSAYDLVISSASGWAKSVRTGAQTTHVCYCHTPIRYIWSDADTYMRRTGYPAPAKWFFYRLLGWLRRKDLRAARGVDRFVANSHYVADRIKRYYDRDSDVIYPPVDVNQFTPSSSKSNYFLVATRLEPYKKVDLVIETFNRLGLPLKVVGSGTELETLRQLAGPTVELLGRVSDEERNRLFAEAKAFINPQLEDFGITPVEALAAGTPVIAFGEGGATETVRDGVDGVHFTPQTAEALEAVLGDFDPTRFDAAVLRQRAEAFSEQVFEQRINALVKDVEVASN